MIWRYQFWLSLNSSYISDLHVVFQKAEEGKGDETPAITEGENVEKKEEKVEETKADGKGDAPDIVIDGKGDAAETKKDGKGDAPNKDKDGELETDEAKKIVEALTENSAEARMYEA